MANFSETATFDAAIYRIDQNDPVLGYDGVNNNIANLQAQALANRTQWLKSKVDSGRRVTGFATLTPGGPGATLSLLNTDMTGKHIRVDVSSYKTTVALPLAAGLSDDANISLSAEAGANPQFISSNDKTVRLIPTAGDHILDLRSGLFVDEIYLSPGSLAVVHKLASNEWIFYIPQNIEDCPAGMVAAWAVNTPPYGWLECNGASLSRTAYAALFANIGVTFGNPGPANFNIPDLRGEFVRGWDHGRGVDSGRAFASAQVASKVLGHIGEANSQLSTGVENYDLLENYSVAGRVTSSTGLVVTHTKASVRPRNVAMMYCIKY